MNIKGKQIIDNTITESKLNLSKLNISGVVDGGVVLDIQGVNGQLFSITDTLEGEIFAISDISGIPILSVDSSGEVTVDGNLDVTGKIIIDSTIKIGSTIDSSTSSNTGTIRYRETTNSGYLEQSMKVGISSYNWVQISTNIGTNYVMVYGKSTPEENAVELQTAYNKAKTMSPTSSNNITIVVSPGKYTFGVTKFTVNTAYINIVSLTGNADVIIDGINVTASNIYLKGLNCGVNSFNISTGLSNLNCEKCIGGDYSFGFSAGNITISGSTFIDCIGGNYSFGCSQNYEVIITYSTFENCVGGGVSFGYSEYGYVTTSGSTFIDCVAGDNSFGCGLTGFSNVYYSTYNNCVGGDNNFAYSGNDLNIIYSSFNNCVGGTYSFSYGSSIGSINYLTIENCVGGSGSFTLISATTKLYRCRLTGGTFMTPISGGKLILCIDGDDNVIVTS